MTIYGTLCKVAGIEILGGDQFPSNWWTSSDNRESLLFSVKWLVPILYPKGPLRVGTLGYAQICPPEPHEWVETRSREVRRTPGLQAWRNVHNQRRRPNCGFLREGLALAELVRPLATDANLYNHHLSEVESRVSKELFR